MPEPLSHRPDVLVLGAGGTLGEAWMRGLLDGAGHASGIDFRDCEYFVGTSAGSIVAAFLAAGREPDSGDEARAASEWRPKRRDNGERGPPAGRIASIRRPLGRRPAAWVGRRRAASRRSRSPAPRPPAPSAAPRRSPPCRAGSARWPASGG